MKGEIDKDFYCAAGICNRSTLIGVLPKCLTNGTFTLIGNPCERCSMRHRKWPTPEQYREKHGKEWPDTGGVYALREVKLPEGWYIEWDVMSYESAKMCDSVTEIVCACTPWGCPPADWRPE